MERYAEKYDKECMKMAILKHEETFRHQVHELHRLYRVQKILMNDLKNSELKRQRMSAGSRTSLEGRNIGNETAPPRSHYSYRDQSRPRHTFNLELPAEEFIGKNGGEVMLEVDENVEENDLELTLAIGSIRRKKKDASFTSDSGASISSSSAESSGVKLDGQEWRLYQSERNNAFNVDEQLRQDRVQHPPWLFQCLSLNMTS